MTLWWVMVHLMGCGFQPYEFQETEILFVCVEGDELRADLSNGLVTKGCEEYVSWDCDATLTDDELVLEAEVTIRRYGKQCSDAESASPVYCPIPPDADEDATWVVYGGGAVALLRDVEPCEP